MRPLVVVDCWSPADPAMGAAVTAQQHRLTAPRRPLRAVRPGDDLAAAFRDAAGIQVTGSPLMLGTPAAAWAPAASRALERAAGRGVPVLGICFGHEMLGLHFGAPLKSWPAPREGVERVRFAEAGPFRGVGEVPVVHTHRDHLASCGPALRAAGEGGLGGVAAFAHPDLPVWGVQGHPELDAALCRLDGSPALAALDDGRLDTPEAKRILANFGALL